MPDLSIKIDNLITSVNRQFNNRTIIENTKKGRKPVVVLNTSITNRILWLHFIGIQTSIKVTIPLPFMKDGLVFIKENEVTRPVCSYWLEKEQQMLDYIAIMYKIVCADTTGIISDNLTKGYPFLQQIIFAFENGNPSIIAYRFQKAINEVVNKMPLHKTNLDSWAMNNRLIIIDEVFDDLSSPKDCLSYQVNKAKKYFPVGWTSIGLSDGVLANKNYILTNDGLRKLSPFGLRYHNPQRNLYSTLGMQGDELPITRSHSMQNLMDQGITRTGWNFFTLFVDIPDIFEDQIVVDVIHKNKFVTSTKKFQIFGKLLVRLDEKIKTEHILGISPDGTNVLFTVNCDSASIKKISNTTANIGGIEIPVYNIVVEYQQNFKDGLKLTNVHGNKGVIRLKPLGYATDPRTGQKHKIDVIVGAKTVGKRKNYGQIIEALTNCLITEDSTKVVFPDNWTISIEKLKDLLEENGFRKNGTWDCNTPYGKLYGICGKVFWGCIKTPEDQIWKKGATTVCDNKGVRKAGLKFSHVEIKALKTIFGNQNPVIDEIMSYAQGVDNLQELLSMIGSEIGILPKHKVVKDINDVKPIDQYNSTLVAGQYINNTVVDEFFMPDGFIFKLPLPYQTVIDIDDKILYKGFPQTQPIEGATKFHLIDRIYISNGTLRKCWYHQSGKYGLNNIGTIVNNVILMSHRVVQNPFNETVKKLYYIHLQTFFNQLSIIIGTKRGQLSNYGMSIRYPFSSKAVATLSTSLPKNTVEIHRTMAESLNVKNNDIVIVERFPCLGFMSIRPQKIHITDDIMCKYTIRVSGNSLVSQNLDFDGDVLFIASFHTPAAKSALEKEWANPNPTYYTEIKHLNKRKGAPHIKCYTLDDYKITPFHDLTNETHANIVEKNTGVKAQTGPIIALTYNIMRIVENSTLEISQKLKVGIEMFLEKAAQSIFEQKHGRQSLHEIVIRSICTGDIESLIKEGFKRSTTTMIIDIVKRKAMSLGIENLVKHHKFAEENNTSNIISLIVRKQNRIYFASRSQLENKPLLEALNGPAVDIPSEMFKRIMSNKLVVTKIEEQELNIFMTEKYKHGCSSLCDIIQPIFNPAPIFNRGRTTYANSVGCRR